MNYCFVLSSGGLAAVIYTDTLQAIIMLCGAMVLCIVGEYMATNNLKALCRSHPHPPVCKRK